MAERGTAAFWKAQALNKARELENLHAQLGFRRSEMMAAPDPDAWLDQRVTRAMDRMEDESPRRRRTKRKSTMAKRKSKKGKSHCKRVKVKKGGRKTRLMCWGANGKIVSAKRSKAGKKAARKRR